MPETGVREVAHLARSFNEMGRQLTDYIEKRDFMPLVFSEEDLFGFDASAVRLVVRERDPDEVEDDVPF